MLPKQAEGFFEEAGKWIGTLAPLAGVLTLNPLLITAASAGSLLGRRVGAEAGQVIDKQVDEYKDTAKDTINKGGLAENAVVFGAPAASLAIPVPGSLAAGIYAADKLKPLARAVDEALSMKVARVQLIKNLTKTKPKTLISTVKGKTVDAIKAIPENKQQAKALWKKFVDKHGLNKGGPAERAAKYTTIGVGTAIPIPGSAYVGLRAAKHTGKIGRKVDKAMGLVGK